MPHYSSLIMLVSGLVIFALGLVLTLRSGLGLGPWDVLHQGMSLRLPLSFGQASILVGAALIAVTIALGERPGLGTLLNMLLIGLAFDAIVWIGFIPDLTGRAPLLQLIMDVCGVAAVGVGSALYIKAGLGAGPRDSLMLALSKLFGARVGWVRAGIELSALAVGFILGGTVGVGTLIFALGYRVRGRARLQAVSGGYAQVAAGYGDFKVA